jgi:hypothetical protein
MSFSYVAIETSPDVRWVYQVSPAYAGTREEVQQHGVLCAARYEGVWMLNGTCVVRDARYREILENTPVLKS